MHRVLTTTAASILILALFGSMPANTAGKKIIVTNVGFATPESVEYYAAEDVYLVTNINGSPFEADGNGFISKISPDGSVIDLKWIDGAKSGTTLHAPKGAAIMGESLYVADRDQVHIFELPSGKQRTSVTIKGSSFLNGIAAGTHGNIYVTDFGVIPGFKPSGTDAVYSISPDGKYEAVIKDKALGKPNGVVADGDELIIVSSSGAVTRIDASGKKTPLPSPVAGGLDGLIKLSDGRLLMSSWRGSSIYVLNRDGSYGVVADNLEAPADIGFDSKRNRVLVPLFKKNQVVFLPL